MTEIYIVHASVGEYSDRREWIVAAYAELALAQTHVTLASAVTRQFEALSEDDRDLHMYDYDKEDPRRYLGFKTYDKRFEASGYSGGPKYWLTKTDLRTKTPSPN